MNYRIGLLCLLLNCLFSFNVYALPFGSFDPRSLAMGGVGVTAGDSANAAYYNPALLALYKVRKETGKNSRFVFPTITARVPKIIENLKDAERQAFDQDIINAITAFNGAAQPNSADAQAVLDASESFQANISSFNDGPVDAQASAGVAIAIAHLRQGGSMYVLTRVVAGSDVSGVNADKQLLSNYIDAMRYISSNQTEGSLHPELFDNNGNLIDQTNSLSSTVAGRGVLIKELGIAMSNTYQVFGAQYAIGFTPKLMRVSTYDIVINGVNGVNNNVGSSRVDDEAWKLNLDIGIIKEHRQSWWSGNIRSGLTIKNIIPRDYLTALGNLVEFRPQLRAATSLHRRGSVYAIDMDVLPNNSIGRGSKSQIVALGGEWKYTVEAAIIKLRAGINHNIKAQGKFKTPLYSVGLHINMAVTVDISYAQSSAEKAAGLQISHRF